MELPPRNGGDYLQSATGNPITRSLVLSAAQRIHFRSRRADSRQVINPLRESLVLYARRDNGIPASTCSNSLMPVGLTKR
jgi:hypothetical protein